MISSDGAKLTTRPAVNRRCSENDIERSKPRLLILSSKKMKFMEVLVVNSFS